LGERGILEVLDAQRILRTVRLQFLLARYDRQLALVDINELKATALAVDAVTGAPAETRK
jgi:cobalt-zinc-cadmium efflux system outer membrane protein